MAIRNGHVFSLTFSRFILCLTDTTKLYKHNNHTALLLIISNSDMPEYQNHLGFFAIAAAQTHD